MCSGLKKFPSEVLENMTLPEAMELTQFWVEHPSLIHGGSGFGGEAGAVSTRPRAAPAKKTTKQDLLGLARELGPTGVRVTSGAKNGL